MFVKYCKVFMCDIFCNYFIFITKNVTAPVLWFGLVCWVYGISTLVGYLTPNPFLCK